MSIQSDNLREFFNHNVTDDAADEIERLESELNISNELLRRCKAVMEINDPTNFKLIFDAASDSLC